MTAPGAVVAIVVAGGTGERFGLPGGKQLALLAGRPVVAWSLLALDAVAQVDRIVLVCHPERVSEFTRHAAEPLALRTPVSVVAGGRTRQASVASGLESLGDDEVGTVIIHDGARPLAEPALFERTLDALAASGADGVVAAHPSIDTVKFVWELRVTETLERGRCWAVQTPQTFRADVIRAAHRAAAAEGFEGTDDATLVERAGGRVEVVEGPRENIKITVPADLDIAEVLLHRRGLDGRP